MEKENQIDLNIDGPDSPISFKKFNGTLSKSEKKEFMVLVDGTGLGIADDDPSFMYLTPERAREQAIYFKDVLFESMEGRQVRMPEYLFRYMSMAYQESLLFSSKRTYAEYLAENPNHYESEQYKRMLNLIKYCDSNKEAAQIIGLIILFAGTLHSCFKEKICVKILIEEPETHLHPKRERMIMHMLHKIKNEFLPDKSNNWKPVKQQ